MRAILLALPFFILTVTDANSAGVCVNVNASSAPFCSEGINSSDQELDLLRYEKSADCTSSNLTTDGQFHCLPNSRTKYVQGGLTGTDAREFSTKPPTVAGRGSQAGIIESFGQALQNNTADEVQLNISGHGAYRTSLDLSNAGINPNSSFSVDNPDGSSLMEVDSLIEAISDDPRSDRPVRLTFDFCFAGNGVEQIAGAFRGERPVCAIGASGKTEFSEAQHSLARIRYKLVNDSDNCDSPTMSDVYRSALRSSKFESIPSLTSNSILEKYRDQIRSIDFDEAEEAAAENAIDVFCLNHFAPQDPALSTMSELSEAVEGARDEDLLRQRLLSMAQDLMVLLRRANIQGCGRIPYNNPRSLTQAKAQCLMEKIGEKVANAETKIATAQQQAFEESTAALHRLDAESAYLEALIKKELMGVDVPPYMQSEYFSSMNAKVKKKIEKQVQVAKEKILAKYNTATPAPTASSEGATLPPNLEDQRDVLYDPFCADWNMEGDTPSDCPIISKVDDWQAQSTSTPSQTRGESSQTRWESMREACNDRSKLINDCYNDSNHQAEVRAYRQCRAGYEERRRARIQECAEQRHIMDEVDTIILAGSDIDDIERYKQKRYDECKDRSENMTTCYKPDSCFSRKFNFTNACSIELGPIFSEMRSELEVAHQQIEERFHKDANEAYIKSHKVALKSLKYRKISSAFDSFSSLTKLLEDNSESGKDYRKSFAETLRCEEFDQPSTCL